MRKPAAERSLSLLKATPARAAHLIFNPRTLQRGALPICLLVLVAIVQVKNSNFLAPTNIANIGTSIAPVATIAMGMAPLLIAGYFDISVGGVAAFLCVLGAKMMNADGVAVGIAIMLVGGAVIGLINATIIVHIRVNSLVATLGTGYILTGLAAVLSGSTQIPVNSQWLVTFINATYLGVPVSVMIFAVVAVLSSWLLHTVLGRGMYAVGSNREAARYAGVSVNLVAMVPFVMTSVFTAVAAVITLGFTGAGLPTTGTNWPLEAIAGSVVGGVSIAGGEGSILAAVFGMILIGLVQNGLVILNIDSNYQDVVLGVIIVLAVAFDVRIRDRVHVLGRSANRNSSSAPGPVANAPPAAEGTGETLAPR